MPFKFVTIEQLRRFSGVTAGVTTSDATLTDMADAYEDEILLLVARFRDFSFGTGAFSVGETHSVGLDETDDSLVLKHHPIQGPATVTDLFSGFTIDPDTFFINHDEGMITTAGRNNWPVGKNRYLVNYFGLSGQTPPSLALLVMQGVGDRFKTKDFPSSIRKYRVDNVEIENNPTSKQHAFFTDAEMRIIKRFRDPYRNCTASF